MATGTPRGRSNMKRGTSSVKGRGSSSLLVKRRRPKVKTQGKRKQSASVMLPDWLHWTLVGLFTLVLLLGAYLYFIKPYLYRLKPCYGSREYGVCIPNGNTYYGIDVSHHQGQIDWKKVVSASAASDYPLKFVFVKATEGASFIDPDYETNIMNARQMGFVCGSYHFYNPRTSPAKQAAFFLDNISLMPGDLAPVIDIEVVGTKGSDLAQDIAQFLYEIENKTGVTPIIYTSAKFKDRYLSDPAFDRFPLWVAHYYVETPSTKATWKIWQFTDKAHVPGILNATDMNVFSGTDSEFRSLLKK